MAQKTIKIFPISETTTEQEIINTFGGAGAKVARVHLGKSQAYVELETLDDLQLFQFIATQNKIDQLNAEFQKVDPSFKWETLSSNSSSIQQLKDQRQHMEKSEQHHQLLTDPAPQTLITVSGVDPSILSKMSENSLKNSVFSEFKSINRILKKGNNVIIQLEDQGEAQKLEAVFPNLRVPSLGSEAYLNLQVQNWPHFASDWIEQHKIQTQIKSQNQQSNKKQQQQQKKYLHDNIIPKIDKKTSMEANFISNQQSQDSKFPSQHNQIKQLSGQNIHTRQQLGNETQQFVLEDQQQKERKQAEKRRQQQEKARAQQQRIRQQKLRAEQQYKRKQQIKKKEEQQRKIKQAQQARKREQETKRKQEEQRKRKQEEQIRKQKQIEEKRKRQEQKTRIRQQQEKKRKQAQQKQIQQRKIKQQEQKRRNQQKKRQDKLKQQEEEKERQFKELEAKANAQRQKALSGLSEPSKLSDFILMPSAETVTRNLQSGIGMGVGKFQQVMGSEPRTPIVFWSLVLVTVFALLLM